MGSPKTSWGEAQSLSIRFSSMLWAQFTDGHVMVTAAAWKHGPQVQDATPLLKYPVRVLGILLPILKQKYNHTGILSSMSRDSITYPFL